ncbi:MAG TPA: ATP-binding protein [Labilithrix sp.]|nr:ATP-binding protein [Labilithrix sp.]
MAVVFLAGLALSAGLAYWADASPGRLHGRHRTVVYALSLSVWDTAWAYLGMGPSVIGMGVANVGTTVGFSLLFLFGRPLLLRVLRIVKAHRISTLTGVLTVRYGRAPTFTALVTVLLIVAMLPYLALQLEALYVSTVALSGPLVPPSNLRGLIVAATLLLAAFAVVFGARVSDPTQRRPGLVLVVAACTVVKVAALAAVGLFVWSRWSALPETPPLAWPDLHLGATTGNSFGTWAGNFTMSLLVFLLLPFNFHLVLSEHPEERQVRLASWTLQLTCWLTLCLQLLIALGGRASGLAADELDGAILVLPLAAGAQPLVVLAYLGLIAAATAMLLVSFIALANMAMLDLVLPALSAQVSRLGPWLRPLRWLVILAIAFLTLAVWRIISGAPLYRIGIVSWVGVIQLAPAFYLGLLWPSLQRRAVAWGIAMSMPVWAYTSLLPAFGGASPWVASLVADGPWGIAFLRPQALCGLEGLDPGAHAFVWCLGVNLAAVAIVSARLPVDADDVERVRSLLHGGEAAVREIAAVERRFDFPEMETLLTRVVGEEQARSEIERLRQEIESGDRPEELRLFLARGALERILSGPLGPSAARALLDTEVPVSDRRLGDVMEAFVKVERMLTHNQEMLANRVRELTFLNAAAEQLVAAGDPEELLTAMDRLLAEAFHFDLVGTFLAADGVVTLSAPLGFRSLAAGNVDVPPDAVLAGVIRDRRMRVQSLPLQPQPLETFLAAEGLQTLVYAPIVLAERLLGVLACGFRVGSMFVSADFRRLLQALANELAVALSGAQHRKAELIIQRQLDATLRHMGEAVMVTRRDGKILMVNPAMVDVMEAPNQEYFLQRPFEEITSALQCQDVTGAPLPIEAFPTYQALHRKLPSEQLAIRIRTVQGHDRVVSVNSVPVLDEAGEAVQAITVYRDQTEFIEFERLKTEFVQMAAHELKTPVAIMKGNAQMLLQYSDALPEVKRRDHLVAINRGADRISHTVSDLLMISELGLSRLAVPMQRLDLAALAAEIVRGMPDDGNRVQLQILAPAVVHGSGERLKQALRSLLDNAVKFSLAGTAIDVIVSRADGDAVVAVEDRGIGIPKDKQARLFERFYRAHVDTPYDYGGLGIGLYLTREIVTRHGGRTGFESEPNRGSTFFFTVPLAEAQPVGEGDESASAGTRL